MGYRCDAPLSLRRCDATLTAMFRERPPARVVTAASPRTPGLTPERPAAPPRAPVGRRPSRVRVHAGDRCVAPAKTKPRKRQAVNEATDMSSLSIDAVQWSDAGYSVTELASCRGRDCPLIVKVTRSYAGELSAELQVDQVGGGRPPRRPPPLPPS